jgi:hypothetical protein
MHVSTLVRRCSALLVVLAAASACSDAPVAPSAPERPAFDIDALQPGSFRGGQGNQTALAGSDTDDVLTLTVDPNASRTYAFGDNWVYFPARSICDPASSGYGIGAWDTPCTALQRPVKVTVHWSNKGGHAYAHFSPELRFVPADAWSASRWVILSLHDHKRIHELSDYKILFDAGGSLGWIDESLTDKTLRAWIDPLHNSVVRRVKHFSGYMLAAGAMDIGRGGMGDASY